MIRGRRPSIGIIGTATHVGGHLVVNGWTLGLCATRCPCHMHPLNGSLVLTQDQHRQYLGLASFPLHNPRPCTCCSPWTVDELVQILRDLADIEALQHQPPATPASS